jgi:hypothetical protein
MMMRRDNSLDMLNQPLVKENVSDTMAWSPDSIVLACHKKPDDG